MTPRCWQTKARDRVAWWLFRLVAHPDVAKTVWDHYRWGRDADDVTWTTAGGSHSHYRIPRPPPPTVPPPGRPERGKWW